MNTGQIVFGGIRELDEPEVEYIEKHQLSVVEVDHFSTDKFCNVLDVGKPLYIHLDLNVIDPKEFPYVACPTSKGVQVETLNRVLKDLSIRFNIVGMSVLECCNDRENDKLDILNRLNFPSLLKS